MVLFAGSLKNKPFLLHIESVRQQKKKKIKSSNEEKQIEGYTMQFLKKSTIDLGTDYEHNARVNNCSWLLGLPALRKN